MKDDLIKDSVPGTTTMKAENGNFVLDTIFESIPDVRNKEIELKNILGVIEVGLFTKHATVYYKAKNDGSFDALRL